MIHIIFEIPKNPKTWRRRSSPIIAIWLYYYNITSCTSIVRSKMWLVSIAATVLLRRSLGISKSRKDQQNNLTYRNFELPTEVIENMRSWLITSIQYFNVQKRRDTARFQCIIIIIITVIVVITTMTRACSTMLGARWNYNILISFTAHLS